MHLSRFLRGNRILDQRRQTRVQKAHRRNRRGRLEVELLEKRLLLEADFEVTEDASMLKIDVRNNDTTVYLRTDPDSHQLQYKYDSTESWNNEFEGKTVELNKVFTIEVGTGLGYDVDFVDVGDSVVILAGIKTTGSLTVTSSIDLSVVGDISTKEGDLVLEIADTTNIFGGTFRHTSSTLKIGPLNKTANLDADLIDDELLTIQAGEIELKSIQTSKKSVKQVFAQDDISAKIVIDAATIVGESVTIEAISKDLSIGTYSALAYESDWVPGWPDGQKILAALPGLVFGIATGGGLPGGVALREASSVLTIDGSKILATTGDVSIESNNRTEAKTKAIAAKPGYAEKVDSSAGWDVLNTLSVGVSVATGKSDLTITNGSEIRSDLGNVSVISEGKVVAQVAARTTANISKIGPAHSVGAGGSFAFTFSDAEVNAKLDSTSKIVSFGNVNFEAIAEVINKGDASSVIYYDGLGAAAVAYGSDKTDVHATVDGTIFAGGAAITKQEFNQDAISTTDNTITIEDHGFTEGQLVALQSALDPAPTISGDIRGIVPGDNVFIHVVDANTIQLSLVEPLDLAMFDGDPNAIQTLSSYQTLAFNPELQNFETGNNALVVTSDDSFLMVGQTPADDEQLNTNPFYTGQAIRYNMQASVIDDSGERSNGEPIDDLFDGVTYYAVVDALNPDQIKLATTESNAFEGIVVPLTGPGTGTRHFLTYVAESHEFSPSLDLNAETGVIQMDTSSISTGDPLLYGLDPTIESTKLIDRSAVFNANDASIAFDATGSLDNGQAVLDPTVFVLMIPNHGFVHGETVRYSTQNQLGESSSPILVGESSELVDGDEYVVIRVDNNSLQLALPETPDVAVELVDGSESGEQQLIGSQSENSVLFEPGGTVRWQAVDTISNSILFADPHRFVDGQRVVYQVNASDNPGTSQPIGGLAFGESYYVIVISEFEIQLSLSGESDWTRGLFTSYVDVQDGAVDLHDGATGSADSLHAFNAKYVDIERDWVISPNHELWTGQAFTYQLKIGSAIGGLVDGQRYYAVRLDANRFRIADSVENASMAANGSESWIDLVSAGEKDTFQRGKYETFVYQLEAGRQSPVVNLDDNQVELIDHGLSNGRKINYRTSGGDPVGGLENAQTYQVIVVDQDHIQLSPVEGLTYSETTALSGDPIDLTAGATLGTGMHVFRVIPDVEIANRSDPIFAFNPTGIRPLDVDEDRIRVQGLGVSTGDPIRYFNGGGVSVGGLTNGQQYYAIRINNSLGEPSQWIRVAATKEEALSDDYIDLTPGATGMEHGIEVDSTVTVYDHEVEGLDFGITYYAVVEGPNSLRLTESPPAAFQAEPQELNSLVEVNAATYVLLPTTGTTVEGIKIAAELEAETAKTAGTLVGHHPTLADYVTRPEIIGRHFKNNRKTAEHVVGVTGKGHARGYNWNFLAGVAWNEIERHDVTAIVGGATGAQGILISHRNVVIESKIDQKIETHASGNAMPHSGKKFIFATALAYSDANNRAEAIIGTHARIDAGGEIEVNSSIEYPRLVDWKDLIPFKGLKNCVDGEDQTVCAPFATFLKGYSQLAGEEMFGLAELLNTWTNSQAFQASGNTDDVVNNGTSFGLSMTFSVGVATYNNYSNAVVQSGAQINQGLSLAGFSPVDSFEESVLKVVADTEMLLVGLSGMIHLNFSFDGLTESYGKRKDNFNSLGNVFSLTGNKSKTLGLGLSLMEQLITNHTVALIESGAIVTTGQENGEGVAVEASTADTTFNFTQSGSDSEGAGIAASQGATVEDSYTIALVENGAHIESEGKLDITAENEALHSVGSGGIAWGETLGLGLSASTVVMDRQTGGFLGGIPEEGWELPSKFIKNNSNTTPVESSDESEISVVDLVVESINSGQQTTVSVVGAISKGGNRATGALSKKKNPVPDGSKNHFGIAGDTAVNVATDEVRASIDLAGRLHVLESVDVAAKNETDFLAIAGATAISWNGGGGETSAVAMTAAVAVNDLDLTTKATVGGEASGHGTEDGSVHGTEDGVWQLGSLAVESESKGDVLSVAVALGISEIDKPSFALNVAFSWASNTVIDKSYSFLKPVLGGSYSIEGEDNIDLHLSTLNSRSINASSGGAAFTFGSAVFDIGIGVSPAVNDVTIETLADIQPGVSLWTDVVEIQSLSKPDIQAWSIAGTGKFPSAEVSLPPAQVKQQVFNLQLAGSVAINRLTAKSRANVGRSIEKDGEAVVTFHEVGNLTAVSKNQSELKAIAGEGFIGIQKNGGKFSIQFGVAFGLNEIDEDSYNEATIVGANILEARGDISLASEFAPYIKAVSVAVSLGVILSPAATSLFNADGVGASAINVVGKIDNKRNHGDKRSAVGVRNYSGIWDSIVEVGKDESGAFDEVDITASSTAFEREGDESYNEFAVISQVHDIDLSINLSTTAASASVGISYTSNEIAVDSHALVSDSHITDIRTMDIGATSGGSIHSVGSSSSLKIGIAETVSLGFLGTFVLNVIESETKAEVQGGSIRGIANAALAAAPAVSLKLEAKDKATVSALAVVGHFGVAANKDGVSVTLEVPYSTTRNWLDNETNAGVLGSAGASLDGEERTRIEVENDVLMLAVDESRLLSNNNSVAFDISGSDGMAVAINAASAISDNTVANDVVASVSNAGMVVDGDITVMATMHPLHETLTRAIDVSIAGGTGAFGGAIAVSKAVATLQGSVKAAVGAGNGPETSLKIGGSTEVISKVINENKRTNVVSIAPAYAVALAGAPEGASVSISADGSVAQSISKLELDATVTGAKIESNGGVNVSSEDKIRLKTDTKAVSVSLAIGFSAGIALTKSQTINANQVSAYIADSLVTSEQENVRVSALGGSTLLPESTTTAVAFLGVAVGNTNIEAIYRNDQGCDDEGECGASISAEIKESSNVNAAFGGVFVLANSNASASSSVNAHTAAFANVDVVSQRVWVSPTVEATIEQSRVYGAKLLVESSANDSATAQMRGGDGGVVSVNVANLYSEAKPEVTTTVSDNSDVYAQTQAIITAIATSNAESLLGVQPEKDDLEENRGLNVGGLTVASNDSFATVEPKINIAVDDATVKTDGELTIEAIGGILMETAASHEFDAGDGVDPISNTIDFQQESGLGYGTVVRYGGDGDSADKNPIGGLKPNETYRVIPVNTDVVRLGSVLVTNAQLSLFFSEEGVTWAEAFSQAQAAGGKLGSIQNDSENEDLLALLPEDQSVWLGGSDAVVEGHWVWDTASNGGRLFWVDGTSSQSGYADWAVGEPTNVGEEYDFVAIERSTGIETGGSWYARNATDKLNYFLVALPDSEAIDLNTDELVFKDAHHLHGAQPNDGGEYGEDALSISKSGLWSDLATQTTLNAYVLEREFSVVTHPSALTWQEAKTAVPTGYQLATIQNATDQRIISNLIEQGTVDVGAWIGASDATLEGTWVWDDADKTRFWVGADDGVPVDGAYSDWNDGEPNNFEGNEDYASIRSDGKWNDLPASSTLKYYVTQKIDPKFELITLSDSMTYDEAYEDAITRGGRLARIISKTQNTDVKTLLLESEYADAWIGATDSETEGTWVWSDAETAFWSGGLYGGPVGDTYANFAPADQVIYDAGVIPIGGLHDGQTYGVREINLSENTLKLYHPGNLPASSLPFSGEQVSDNRIIIPNHQFSEGDAVTYRAARPLQFRSSDVDAVEMTIAPRDDNRSGTDPLIQNDTQVIYSSQATNEQWYWLTDGDDENSDTKPFWPQKENSVSETPYSNWNPGEPNLLSTEHVATIYPTGEWNNFVGTEILTGYLLERPQFFLSDKTGSVSQRDSILGTYDGVWPATITSQDEWELANTAASGNEAYLGGSDADDRSHWYWTSDSKGPESGKEFWDGKSGGDQKNGYESFWSHGEPNDTGLINNETQIKMSGTTGLWNDVDGDGVHHWLLESLQFTFVDFEGTYDEAKRDAIVNQGGWLATIQSPEENALATTAMASHPEAWIGASSNQLIDNLTDGQAYFVTGGHSGADQYHFFDPSDTAFVNSNPIPVSGLNKSDQVEHFLTKADEQPIEGLVEGQTYYVINAEQDSFQLAATLPDRFTKNAITLSGFVSNAQGYTGYIGKGSTLGVEGIDLTDPGRGRHKLIVDLTEVGSDTQKLEYVSPGWQSPVTINQGLARAVTTGGGGGLVGVGVPRAISSAKPNVKISIGSGVSLQGDDVYVLANAHGNAETYTENTFVGILVEVGNSTASVDAKVDSQIQVKGAVHAQNNLTIRAENADSLNATAKTYGGGLFPAQNSWSKIQHDYTTKVEVDDYARLSAGNRLELNAFTSFQDDLTSFAKAGGAIGELKANAHDDTGTNSRTFLGVRVGSDSDNVETSVNVSESYLRAETVEIEAKVHDAKAKTFAEVQGAGLMPKKAKAVTYFFDQTFVDIGSNTVIDAREEVTVRAKHENIDVNAHANFKRNLGHGIYELLTDLDVETNSSVTSDESVQLFTKLLNLSAVHDGMHLTDQLTYGTSQYKDANDLHNKNDEDSWTFKTNNLVTWDATVKVPDLRNLEVDVNGLVIRANGISLSDVDTTKPYTFGPNETISVAPINYDGVDEQSLDTLFRINLNTTDSSTKPGSTIVNKLSGKPILGTVPRVHIVNQSPSDMLIQGMDFETGSFDFKGSLSIVEITPTSAITDDWQPSLSTDDISTFSLLRVENDYFDSDAADATGPDLLIGGDINVGLGQVELINAGGSIYANAAAGASVNVTAAAIVMDAINGDVIANPSVANAEPFTIKLKERALYPDRVLQRKPDAYWRLGESIRPEAVDSSGNGHNGVYGDSVELHQTGAIVGENTAVRFPGDTLSYVKGSDFTPSGLDGQTISGWFMVDRTDIDWQAIYFLGSPGTGNTDYTENGSNRENTFWVGRGGFLHVGMGLANQTGQHELTTEAGLIEPGRWYHFATAVNAEQGEMKLFLNGREQNSVTFDKNSKVRSESGDWHLGNSPSKLSGFYGWLDEVAIFNRSLSDAEVRKLYLAFGPAANARWGMNEFDGTEMHDSSTNEIDGNYSHVSHELNAGPLGFDNAVRFDGTTESYAIVNDNAKLNDAHAQTVSGWFQIDKFTSEAQTIFSKGPSASSASESDLTLWVDRDGTLNLSTPLVDGSFTRLNSKALLVRPGQWYYFTVVVDPEEQSLQIFLNGQEEAKGLLSGNDSSSQLTIPNGRWLLANDSAGIDALNGSLFDISVFNEALTPFNISARYETNFRRRSVLQPREVRSGGDIDLRIQALTLDAREETSTRFNLFEAGSDLKLTLLPAEDVTKATPLDYYEYSLERIDADGDISITAESTANTDPLVAVDLHFVFADRNTSTISAHLSGDVSLFDVGAATVSNDLLHLKNIISEHGDVTLRSDADVIVDQQITTGPGGQVIWAGTGQLTSPADTTGPSVVSGTLVLASTGGFGIPDQALKAQVDAIQSRSSAGSVHLENNQSLVVGDLTVAPLRTGDGMNHVMIAAEGVIWVEGHVLVQGGGDLILLANGSSSYQYISDELTFDDARAEARRRGGTLAILNDQTTQEAVQQVAAGNPIWIGASDAQQEGIWVWETPTDEDVTSQLPFWAGQSDGVTVNHQYTNWNVGEPNNYDDVEDHIEVNGSTGKWNDLNKKMPRQYILELGKNYSLSTHTFTYDEAVVDAASQGGRVATIASEADQFEFQRLAGSVSFWIDGSDELQEGTWTRRFDGLLLDSGYMNWYPGEPNDFQGTEDAAIMYSDGEWNDRYGEDPLPFVVEYSSPSSIVVNGRIETVGGRGDINIVGSSGIRINRELEVIEGAIDYNQAIEQANVRGGWLSIVNSDAINDDIEGLLDGRSALAGGTDQGHEGIWDWTNAPSVTGQYYPNPDTVLSNDGIAFYADGKTVNGLIADWNVDTGEPNGTTSENILEIESNGQWNDLSAGANRDGYLLQLPSVRAMGAGQVLINSGTVREDGILVDSGQPGSVWMQDGSTIAGEHGNLIVLSANDVWVSNLATGGDVLVLAGYDGVEANRTNGDAAIIDNLSGDLLNVNASSVILVAEGGVGSVDAPLYTDVTTLSVRTDSGDIAIRNHGDLVIEQVEIQTTGMFRDIPTWNDWHPIVEASPRISEWISQRDLGDANAIPGKFVLGGLTILDFSNVQQGVHAIDVNSDAGLTIPQRVPIINLDSGGITLSALSSEMPGAVPGLATGLIKGGSFEMPTQLADGFSYNPQGSDWVFSGSSGITGNGSGFTNRNPDAPLGNQVAFIQQEGSISQPIEGLLPGNSYLLEFDIARRSDYAVPTIKVKLDGKLLTTQFPVSTSYQTVGIPFVFDGLASDASVGASTLTFTGFDTSLVDQTAFVDGINIKQRPLQFVEGDFTWSEANEDALSRGGYLASIANIQAQQDAQNTANGKEVWLASRRVPLDDKWVWSLNNSDALPFYVGDADNGYSYLDRYENWGSGEPKNSSAGDAGIMQTNGTWASSDGMTTKMGYLLQQPATSNLVIQSNLFSSGGISTIHLLEGYEQFPIAVPIPEKTCGVYHTFSKQASVVEGSTTQVRLESCDAIDSQASSGLEGEGVPEDAPRYFLSTDKEARDNAVYSDGTLDVGIADFDFENDGRYGVFARVLDSDGEYTDYKTFVQVQNVTPSDLVVEVDSFLQGPSESTTLSGTFLDPGIADNHVVTIDWGDDSPVTVIQVEGPSHSFSSTHAYERGGIYLASARVTEAGMYEPIRTNFNRYVSGVGLHDGELQIIGTTDDDDVEIQRRHLDLAVSGNLAVTGESDNGGSDSTSGTDSPQVFSSLDVTSVFMTLFDGADQVRVRSSVNVPIEVHGGPDNDRLFAGSGPAHLFGDEGTDILRGGSNHDRLSGGDDDDLLFGEGGNDVLDGGSGVDELFGGIGDDQFIYSGAGDFFWGGIENHVDRLVVQTGEPMFVINEALLDQLDSIEAFDLHSALETKLRVVPDAVLGDTSSEHALLTYVSDYEKIELEPTWTLWPGGTQDGDYYRRYRTETAEIDVSGPIEWQNPVLSYDVDGNGTASARDALLIINELSSRRFSAQDGALSFIGFSHDHQSVDWENFYYFDTSGNDRITALDALRVINHLERLQGESNSATAGEGEGAVGQWDSRAFDVVSGRSHKPSRALHPQPTGGPDAHLGSVGKGKRALAGSDEIDFRDSFMREDGLRELDSPSNEDHAEFFAVERTQFAAGKSVSSAEKVWTEGVDEFWASHILDDDS